MSHIPKPVNINYAFKNQNLYTLALTHRSYNSQSNYERLEFLGDALLSVVISEALYERYPDQKEGKLTRMRATLVRQETLVKLAQRLNIPPHLTLGAGEIKGGGRQRASILADVVESLIGAIYLDSGDIRVVKQCVLSWYGNLLDDVNEQKVLKDPKSRLQEWLQAKQFALPTYQLLDTKGNAPNQTFIVRCQVDVDNVADVVQSGESRRTAEQKTAEIMLTQLNKLS